MSENQMTENHIIYFRLDLSNKNHLKAARYIDTLGRERFGSVGDAISAAVIGYFEGMPGGSEGETPAVRGVSVSSDADSDILQDIIEMKLKEVIPKCLEDYFNNKSFQLGSSDSGISKEGEGSIKPEEESVLKKVESDIAWDFLGG